MFYEYMNSLKSTNKMSFFSSNSNTDNDKIKNILNVIEKSFSLVPENNETNERDEANETNERNERNERDETNKRDETDEKNKRKKQLDDLLLCFESNNKNIKELKKIIRNERLLKATIKDINNLLEYSGFNPIKTKEPSSCNKVDELDYYKNELLKLFPEIKKTPIFDEKSFKFLSNLKNVIEESVVEIEAYSRINKYCYFNFNTRHITNERLINSIIDLNFDKSLYDIKIDNGVLYISKLDSNISE